MTRDEQIILRDAVEQRARELATACGCNWSVMHYPVAYMQIELALEQARAEGNEYE